MSPRSQIAHGRPRPLGLPTASRASRAGQSSSGLHSGLCLGPLIPLSKFINSLTTIAMVATPTKIILSFLL